MFHSPINHKNSFINAESAYFAWILWRYDAHYVSFSQQDFLFNFSKLFLYKLKMKLIEKRKRIYESIFKEFPTKAPHWDLEISKLCDFRGNGNKVRCSMVSESLIVLVRNLPINSAGQNTNEWRASDINFPSFSIKNNRMGILLLVNWA